MSRSSLLFTGGAFGSQLDCPEVISIEDQVLAALEEYDAAKPADVLCGDGKIEYTYTLTNSQTHQPIPGVAIRITSDSDGLVTLWTGTTDVLGIARNACNDKPRLAPATVYIFRSLAGYQFANPDVEVVSQ